MTPDRASPRTRRAVIAAAITSIGGLIAASLRSPTQTRGASGDPLLIGQANDAGMSQTVLRSAGLGAGFTLRTTNGSSGATGIFGWSSSGGPNETRGVYGRVEGPNSVAIDARQGGASGSGTAIRAHGGNNHGVLADTNHEDAYAVHAVNSATGGEAILAEATAIPASFASAIRAVNWSSGSVGSGVLGVHAGTGDGVVGAVSYGRGVYGYGGSIGVQGQTLIGVGVYGRATSTTGETFGVRGASDSDAGVGVQGTAGAGAGVGVYGAGGASGYGIYSLGNAHVQGTLSKSAGGFKIDHPLDPEGQYLSHSFVESPDMKNIYDGTLLTDAHGLATVQLPVYFSALNRDVRYQLTTIGDARAWVASKVVDNAFVVATDRPRVEVCWQVTGTRRDAYAEAHRIVVEEPKAGSATGRFLHPELFGAPTSANVDRFARSSSEPPASAARV